MLRQAMALLLALALLLPSLPTWAESPIRVLVDGREVTFDVAPQVIGGRTLVPLRAIFEALGARVAWDGQNQSITATGNGREVRLALGSATAFVDGQPVSLDVPPALFQGRTLVPTRFVSEALGATVAWDSESRAVVITTGAAPAQTLAAETRPDTGLPVAVDGSVPAEIVQLVAQNLPLLWPAVVLALGGLESAHQAPRVMLFADRERWFQRLLADQVDEYTARKLASHGAGSARAGRPYEVYLLADDTRWNYRRILAHELGHVVIQRRGLDHKIPQWLHEGLVEYTAQALTEGDPRSALGSRYWAGVRQRILDLAATRGLEPLFSEYTIWIDRFDNYPEYDQALLAVTLLVQRWGGPDSPARYLEALEASDHATAFYDAFRVRPADFELSFLGYLYGQADRPAGPVRVTLWIPDSLSGQLKIFPPGTTRAEGWVAGGPTSVAVTVDANGHIHVAGLGPAGTTWTLLQPSVDLLIYFAPTDPVAVGDRRSTGMVAVFKNAHGSWYWSQNTAFWGDEDQDTSVDDPAYPFGVEVMEVVTGR